MNDRIKFQLEDLTFNAQYEILEYSKENEELKEIAIRKGLQLPSKDISIFKCKYAMIDEENRNGCTLPRKEVKKALRTIVGKAIDKDHLRKSTIGYWLDAQLDDNDIIAYGAFWKSNFPEDYEDIKNRMSAGSMKISFEAWGDREFTGEKSYKLNNIEFAGGALLFDTIPAFPDAEVLEFSAKKGQVLEFAKVIEEAKTEATVLEEEAKTMVKKCKVCEKEVMLKDDQDTCTDCLNIDEESKKKKKSEEDKTCSNKEKLTDSSAKENEIKKEGGNIVDELIKKYNKASVEELSKFMDETLASLSAKDVELATLKSEKETIAKQLEDSKLVVENAKLETEKIKTEFETVKAELDKRVLAEKAAFVKLRKDELGEEFAKDLTDEDITNDLKFENAKLKKELALVKATQEKGSITTGLEAGSKKVEVVTEIFKKQDSIREQAFGK